MIAKIQYCILCLCLLCSVLLQAQINLGGQPQSEQLKLSVPTSIALAQPDWQRVAEEDKGPIGATRYAVPVACDYSPSNSGEWSTLPDGSRLWRLHLQTAEGLGILLTYQQFQLPQGARLYVYSPDYQQLLGAYSAANNHPSGDFVTDMIFGKNIVLEYTEPANTPEHPFFTINKAYIAYKTDNMLPNEVAMATGFGTAAACHVNINCPAGANWQDEKRGIVRIRMVLAEGVGWCTGSLVNNTANNGTPYVLSAFHCDDGYTPIYNNWIFYFNYESSDCSNPALQPTLTSMTGCQLRAAKSETDFQLLELNAPIPSSYNPYFNAWNRSKFMLPSQGTMVHHPNGDIKKISVDNQALVILNSLLTWNNNVTSPSKSHFRAIFDTGIFEPGSSGAPIFNQNSQIVGQLHGGPTDTTICNNKTAYFGRFSLSWDGDSLPSKRLKEWLDPLNTGDSILAAINNPLPTTVSVGGTISTWQGALMPNVMVTLSSGTYADTSFTDAVGHYTFSGIPIGAVLNIQPIRTDSAVQNVSGFDIINIQKHILGITYFNNPYKAIAADCNGSSGVSGLDLVQMRKLILGIISTFPGVNSWRFVPTGIVFTDNNNPWPNVPSSNEIIAPAALDNVNFIGIKTGNVN